VKSESNTARAEGLWSRRLGRGEERNSSILSVSGTGSIVVESCESCVDFAVGSPWVESPVDHRAEVVMCNVKRYNTAFSTVTQEA